jgi:beta-xylosidase
MNKLLILALFSAMTLTAGAQHTLTRQQALSLYTTKAPARTSVHDPSVVWDQQSRQYYIFGSHRAQARTADFYHWTYISPAIPWGTVSNGTVVSDVSNQDAFTHPQVTSLTTAAGKTITLPDFDAEAWAAMASASGDYTVDGYMWAPDIIYNPVMKKWCQYLSIDGDYWASSILLLTADDINGPYVYQGPVVIGGFNGKNANSYKNTDLEQVIGTQASLPARYNKQDNWGNTWPNCIDPCVFYDEDGQLWMSYGSWSGGVFMLKLDPATGLRDYDATYPTTGSGDTYTSDAYFGTKIAGGFYSSGEGSYIQHIGDYYYLFMSYGGLTADGGYEMEVFRSKNPDGPYTDPKGQSPIFTKNVMNYGTKGSYRGEKIFGNYENWGFMTTGKKTSYSTPGELSQGHNSAITDSLGRSLLVYHTRFNDGTEGHSVRVHQLFTTSDGWLAAAPFEFTGETDNDDSIAHHQRFSAHEMAGTYQVLVHKQGVDYANKETVKPISLTLSEDGKVTGDLTGTWSLTDSTSYMTIKVGGNTYQAVVVEQQMEPYTIKAIAFSGVGSSATIWGYKMEDPYALAYLLRTATMPVSAGSRINSNVNLYGLTDGYENVSVEWQSSNPDILSHEGRYNPDAMTEDAMPVDLVMTLTAGDWQVVDTIAVSVRKSTIPATADCVSGAKAYYSFDGKPVTNAFDSTQVARLRAQSSATAPSLQSDHERSGQFVHTSFGASGRTSYVQMTNPLNGATLTDGFTVSYWTKLTDTNNWDCLFSFYNSLNSMRLYMTGNLYVGYNNNTGNWIDLNHPNDTVTGYLTAGKWALVTMTVSRTDGVKLYVNGSQKNIYTANGAQNGTSITSRTQFDYNEFVDFVAACPNMYIGYGSFWGSAEASFDDLLVYDRVLSRTDVRGLNMVENRVHDIYAMGIADQPTANRTTSVSTKVYNLQGQCVGTSLQGLQPGLYIQGGRKYVVK